MAFNLKWVGEVTPQKWAFHIGIVMLFVISLVICVFYYDYIFIPTKGSQAENCFYNPNRPEIRLSCLAVLFKLKPIFMAGGFDERSRDVFFNQPSLASQLAPFESAKSNANDLIVVIKGLYIALADINTIGENTGLLEVMLDSILHAESVEYNELIRRKRTGYQSAKNEKDLEKLKQEISYWLEARNDVVNNNLKDALHNYNNAITENTDNPALLFERGQLLILIEDYPSALTDFNAALTSSENFDDSGSDNIPVRTFPPSDSIMSTFSTHSQRVNSILVVVSREENLWPILQIASPSEYPSLAKIGLIPFSVPKLNEENQ